MQGFQVFECYHTATTTVSHHRQTNSVVTLMRLLAWSTNYNCDIDQIP